MSDGQGAYLNCVAFVVITMLYILLTAIGYVIVCTVADINPHCANNQLRKNCMHRYKYRSKFLPAFLR